MSRRRVLTDEQADQLYREYCLWLSLFPKRLLHKYGISRSTFNCYAHRDHRRMNTKKKAA